MPLRRGKAGLFFCSFIAIVVAFGGEGRGQPEMSDVCDMVDFDPVSGVSVTDPYEFYCTLCHDAPVHYSRNYGFDALSRHHDVIRAHRGAEVG